MKDGGYICVNIEKNQIYSLLLNLFCPKINSSIHNFRYEKYIFQMDSLNYKQLTSMDYDAIGDE